MSIQKIRRRMSQQRNAHWRYDKDFVTFRRRIALGETIVSELIELYTGGYRQ